MKFTILILLVASASLALGWPWPAADVPLNPRGARIVGGVIVNASDVKYIASLQVKGQPVCGASILKSKWVITAARCIPPGALASDIKIVAGELNLSANEGTEQVRSVKKITLHGSFVYGKDVNDLAVLELATPLIFNSKVGSIALAEPAAATESPVTTTAPPTTSPAPTPAPGGSTTEAPEQPDGLWVSGWGLTEDGYASSLLQKVKVVETDGNDCTAVYKKTFKPDKMICAKSTKSKGSGWCDKDTGGPLALVDTDGNISLVGIASFVQGCPSQDKPGVFTKINASYTKWIEKSTQ